MPCLDTEFSCIGYTQCLKSTCTINSVAWPISNWNFQLIFILQYFSKYWTCCRQSWWSATKINLRKWYTIQWNVYSTLVNVSNVNGYNLPTTSWCGFFRTSPKITTHFWVDVGWLIQSDSNKQYDRRSLTA